MISENDRITRRQHSAICFTAMLLPIVRGYPGEVVSLAGRAGWVSTLLAIIPLGIAAYLLVRILDGCGEGVGLAERMLQILGRPLGRLLLLLYTLWLIYYAAVILRSGAERFMASLYPNGKPWLFVVIMAALSMLAGSGGLRALGRFAEVFRPAMLATFAVIFLFSLPEVTFENLLPVSSLDAVPAIRGVIPAAGTMSLIISLGFLENRVEGEGHRGTVTMAYIKVIVLGLSITALLIAELLGAFGPELLTKLDNPLFMMIRDITVLSSLTRVEAVIIAIWVVTDFIIVSAMIKVCGANMALALNIKNRRWLPVVIAAAIMIIALTEAPTERSMLVLTERVIPTLNAVFIYVTLPVLFVVSRLSTSYKALRYRGQQNRRNTR